MLRDERFGDDDILAVVDQLREYGGKSFNFSTLEASRSFYQSDSIGHWSPATVMEDKEVILLGSGPGVHAHKSALEEYVRKYKPLVVALNTQSGIDERLIDLRIACHPVRLLANAATHTILPQPLIVPFSNLPSHLQDYFKHKTVHDFGLCIHPGTFIFNDRYCTIPNSLVLGYALAVLTSGKAKRVLMAGFDGYTPGDARNDEVQMVLSLYLAQENSLPLFAVTPTTLKNIKLSSIYGL
jgi:4-hydroxy 2-oxovalerate aldolase